MGLPDNLAQDLNTLEEDLEATQAATDADIAAAAALTSAQDHKQATAADLTKAQQAQATQLDKVKGVLDSIYGKQQA